MSCHNCKNRVICSIYKNINDEVSQGLKMQVLTTIHEKTESTSSSWMQIFKSLANSCTRYSDSGVNYRKFYNKDILKYQSDIVKRIKKNKEFVKEFLSAYSEENRTSLINYELDNEYDETFEFLMKHLKNEDDVNNFMETFHDDIEKQFGL